MVQDIAPSLYKKVEREFNVRMDKDRTVQRVLKRVRDGTATQTDVAAYADRVGIHSSGALRKFVKADNLPEGKLYWNIADRTIRPQLEAQHALIIDAAQKTQKTINAAAGYNIAPASPSINGRKVYNILNAAVFDGADLDAVLHEPVITMARAAYDTFQYKNAENMASLGVNQIIIREYDGVGLHNGRTPCQFCIDRAGTWSYWDGIDAGVFQRHDGCGCTVTVVYESGVRQDPWTKAEWDERKGEERAAAIEEKQKELMAQAEKHKADIKEREVFIREQMNNGMTAKSAYAAYLQQAK